MICKSLENNLKEITTEFNFKSNKKYKLFLLLGLLGDFDSIEYAINLKKFTKNFQHNNLEIHAIAIGNEEGRKKFCNYTGFPMKNLKVVSDNTIHNNLKASKGIDIGLGGWINMLIMLSGIYSLKTIKEVIRGYTGDRNAEPIYSAFERIKVLNFLKFSGNSFKLAFGDGYLRPFELATFRLNNMNEIIQNWGDYILNEKYLPQRGASFLLNENNQVIYEFYSIDVLGYSSNMRDPLRFLADFLK